MSEVLARIRVHETHGIRRFLYPLTVYAVLPPDTHLQHLRLVSGESDIPMQVNHRNRFSKGEFSEDVFRVDLAVSLNPYAEQELTLSEGKSSAVLDDPLMLTKGTNDKLLTNQQQRFALSLLNSGVFGEVVYDSIAHLRGPLEIIRNGVAPLEQDMSFYNAAPDFSTLSAWAGVSGRYPDGVACTTDTEITACKSWVTISHKIEQPEPGDEIIFTLPLAITSPTLTCDFGVGGYIFGKMDSKAAEIVWRTEFGDAPYAKWTVATAGRVDYIGEVDSAETFLPQRWLHLIDSDKALAVAITKLPESCQTMTVRLTIEGDVSIAFKLGETVSGPAEFGVCYHFLNGVPAIAAATNPQSILLPPVVEVLPA